MSKKHTPKRKRSLAALNISATDRARIQKKIARLSPTLQAALPNVQQLKVKDFWLTPKQAGKICGGISDDSVIERMYEGSAFFNTINVSRSDLQPIFRIPLVDCIDFLLARREGDYEQH